jgi:uncharacterized metal-binding protein
LKKEKIMTEKNMGCARCPFPRAERYCQNEEGRHPSFCPTRNRPEILQQALQKLEDPQTREFATQAALQEKEGYLLDHGTLVPVKPRLLEIVEFAHKMKYQRLGLAFCSGLFKEAGVIENFLSEKGFTVVSAVCKAGKTPKEDLGLRPEQKLRPDAFEPMCNPIFQAMILNDGGSQFNIVLGLCVGHDSLFFQHAEALCTVLAAKDRLLGHNPLAAVYNLDSYYGYLKK